MCRRVALAIVSLFALIVLGLALATYNITRPEPPASGAQTAIHSEPPEVARRKAEETLDQLEERLRQPAPTPKIAPQNGLPQRPQQDRYELRVTEQEANRLLQDLPQVRQLTDPQKIRDLRVRFQQHRLVASARVPVQKEIYARVSAEGSVTVQRGKVALQTKQVWIGNFPAPNAVRQELDKQLAAGVAKLNEAAAGRIESVELKPGQLIVRGFRKPTRGNGAE